MEVAITEKDINVSKLKYILDLLVEISILGCKSSYVLIDVGKNKRYWRTY